MLAASRRRGRFVRRLGRGLERTLRENPTIMGAALRQTVLVVGGLLLRADGETLTAVQLLVENYVLLVSHALTNAREARARQAGIDDVAALAP